MYSCGYHVAYQYYMYMYAVDKRTCLGIMLLKLVGKWWEACGNSQKYMYLPRCSDGHPDLMLLFFRLVHASLHNMCLTCAYGF